MIPTIILGPILRGVAPDGLSVWVETSGPCEVRILGRSTRTFQLSGHHYGLVDLDALPPTTATSYTVELDGRQAWPNPPTAGSALAVDAPVDGPRIVIGDGEPLRIMAGSCRQQAPQPLWLRRRPAGFGDLGPDALAVLSHEMQYGRRPHPDLLILTGDQVYADEQHRTVRAALRRRRGRAPTEGHPEITSFEEYTWLYQQTWSHPLIRWLLATVPSLMIFDDHDVIDDWNISDSWADDMASKPWWADRIRSALMSYWVYQHIGNLSAADRAGDETYQAVVAADDGAPILAELATRLASGSADRLAQTWSYRRQTDAVDIVVLDTRNARVLEPEHRSMLSPADWTMLEQLTGTGDAADSDVGPSSCEPSSRVAERHLLIVSSVPWALPGGIHRLQEWVSHLADNEPVGQRSGRVRRLGEKIRREVDLEHWPAFGDSYDRLRQLLGLAGRRSGGGPPTTVVLSGDVHFGYIAQVDLGPGARAAHQVVASPLRQVELGYERAARRMSMSRFGRWVLDGIASRSAARTKPISFELTDGPIFDNNIATLSYWPDRAEAAIERAKLDRSGRPELLPAARRKL